MASLDNLEGDAIEGVIAVALIGLIIVILFIYFKLGSNPWNPILNGLWAAIQRFLSWLLEELKKLIPSLPDAGTGGGGTVFLGDDSGSNSDFNVITGSVGGSY